MTENNGVEQGISRDEALAIAEKKLRAKRVTVVTKPSEGEVVRVRKQPEVAALLAAHYEKARSRMDEGSGLRKFVDQMEGFAYDIAKVSGWALGGADIVAGGLLAYHGVRGGVFNMQPDELAVRGRNIWKTTDRWGGAAKLLGGIGVLRYGPATMVARTALNLTL